MLGRFVRASLSSVNRAVLTKRGYQFPHKANVRSSSSKITAESQRQVALYIHWPYCKSICPYCDFNRYISESVDHERMKNSYITEFNQTCADFQLNASNFQIFFGGGTPSLAKPETLAAIIDHVKSNFSVDSNLEVTMEANPTSVEAAKLKEFRDAGINRVSFGIQSLVDDDLKYLGRNHSSTVRQEALKTIETGRSLFDEVSFDLIYARRLGHQPSAWREELRRALALGTNHISLYSLAYESGTIFERKMKEGKISPADEATQSEMFEICLEETSRVGLYQYEVSNFARPGHECKHNLTYWNYGEYMGLGPGAASRLIRPDGTREAFTRLAVPGKWMQVVEGGGGGGGKKFKERLQITNSEAMMESLMVGLRTSKGINKQRFESMFNVSLNQYLDANEVRKLTAEGLLENTPQFLRVTKGGIQVLNPILERIVSK